MNAEFAGRCYRLALSFAVQGDLSSAAVYARHACWFDADNENAANLLKLCLYELGESAESNDGHFAISESEKINALIRRKKWGAAARLAKSVPHQNVRILNIQGCIHACAKRYRKAARMFAKALEKDCGNRLAFEGLMELTNRRGRFMGSK